MHRMGRIFPLCPVGGEPARAAAPVADRFRLVVAVGRQVAAGSD